MLINKGISVLYFVRLIKWDLAAIFAYAILVGTLDSFAFFSQITIPLAVSALIATLLSLLLAFRTSQSYERWWEARIIWGAIVNDSRTLIRQLIEFLPDGASKSSVLHRFATRQSVWCFSLSEKLRNCPNSSHVQAYITEHKLTAKHLPNLLLTLHAKELAAVNEQMQFDAIKAVQIDSTLQRLTDSMGKAERIKTTVFPKSYSILIHFLIYVLMTILPFGLDDNHPLVETGIVTLVPILFITIERTAILMQDPFENRPTDTAMTQLSINIEQSLMEMIEVPVPERQAVQHSYYVM